jgi:hypothetical protein
VDFPQMCVGRIYGAMGRLHGFCPTGAQLLQALSLQRALLEVPRAPLSLAGSQGAHLHLQA